MLMIKIKYLIWKLTHYKEYVKRRNDIFAKFVEQMEKQETYRKILMKHAKKYGKVPKEYVADYIAMRKIKKPWNEDPAVIMKMKAAARRCVFNEHKLTKINKAIAKAYCKKRNKTISEVVKHEDNV
jgi:hypothetical protein